MSAIAVSGGHALVSGGLVFLVASGGAGTNGLILLFPGQVDMGTTIPVDFTIPIVGGTGTYTGFSSSGLPPGVTFSGDGNNNGLLSGTPTTASGSPFTATLTVNDNGTTFGTLTLICNVS